MLRQFANRFPILSFVVFSYLITWTIWLTIPAIAGNDWVLIKILTGAGIAAGLVAVVMDRLRHGWNANDFSRRWWVTFCCVAMLVIGLDVWSLIDGDGYGKIASQTTPPPGLSFVGLAAALFSGAMSGFVFATARASTSSYLNSIGRFRCKVRWLLVALFLPATLLGMGVGLSAFLNHEIPDFPLAETSWVVWLPYLTRAFLFSFLVVTVNEEPAWRGYLLPELQRRFSPLISTLALGLIWGLWHLPVYFIGLYDYPGSPLVNALVFTVIVTVLAFLFTWMFNQSGGILLVALILHAANNTATKIVPSTGWFTAALLVAAVFAIVHGRMWRRISVSGADA